MLWVGKDMIYTVAKPGDGLKNSWQQNMWEMPDYIL